MPMHSAMFELALGVVVSAAGQVAGALPALRSSRSSKRGARAACVGETPGWNGGVTFELTVPTDGVNMNHAMNRIP